MNIVEKEKKDFKKFLKKNIYNALPLREDEFGRVFYKEELVSGGDYECEELDDLVNAGYKLKNPTSKLISNLFHYEFEFKGKWVKSIESVLQSLKFKDPLAQDCVFNYYGTEANHIKFATDYDWKENHTLYWQGKPMDRFGVEYQEFILDLYISAIQNPLYRSVLASNTKHIIHTIGVVDPKETVLTRFEFEKMLNMLSKYLKTACK